MKKSKILKLASTLLIFTVLFALFGCESYKKTSFDRDRNDNNKNGNHYEQQDNSDNSSKTEICVIAPDIENIDKSTGFKISNDISVFINNKAWVLLTKNNIDFLASIDTNGKVYCLIQLTNHEELQYYDIKNDKVFLLFNEPYEDINDRSDEGISVSKCICLNSSGKTLYESTFNFDIETGLSDAKFLDNGSILVLRKADIYEGNNMQMAYINPEGELVYDWFDIIINGEKVDEISLSHNAFCNDEYIYLHDDSDRLLVFNTNNKTITMPIESEIEHTTIDMNGYYCFAKNRTDSSHIYRNQQYYTTEQYIVKDDELIYKTNYINMDSFSPAASDFLVYDFSNSTLRDVSTGEIVATTEIDEQVYVKSFSAFKNGYALVIADFYDTSSDDIYAFTLIDSNGKIMFEPKPVSYTDNISWDGNNIFIDNGETMYFYDTNGNVCFETEGYDYAAEISEGCIWVVSDDKHMLLKADGTMLFSDGMIYM